MSIPAVPNTTCEVTWIENGVIVTDGLPAVVVGYFHPQGVDNMVPMTSMCNQHYFMLNPREFSQGLWSFTAIAPITPAPAARIPLPDAQAPPRLTQDHLPWLTTQYLKGVTYVRQLLRLA